MQNDIVKHEHEFPVALVSSLTWPTSYYGYSVTGKSRPVVDAVKHRDQLVCHLFVIGQEKNYSSGIPAQRVYDIGILKGAGSGCFTGLPP